MNVTRILHHSVNILGRLDDSIRFYEEIIGLPSEERPMIAGVDGAWFRSGPSQVHLVDAEEGAGAIRPTAAHVCFGVTDLDAAIDELEDRGIPYERGAQGSVVQIWIVDPSGNVVELQQDPHHG